MSDPRPDATAKPANRDDPGPSHEPGTVEPQPPTATDSEEAEREQQRQLETGEENPT